MGVLSDDVTVDRVTTHVDWEDAPLFDDEVEGGSYSDVFEETLKWNVPAYAPDGPFITTFKGYTEDDEVAWCVSAVL